MFKLVFKIEHYFVFPEWIFARILNFQQLGLLRGVRSENETNAQRFWLINFKENQNLCTVEKLRLSKNYCFLSNAYKVTHKAKLAVDLTCAQVYPQLSTFGLPYCRALSGKQ